MTKTRRIAVAIDLSFALRHHHDVFAGIARYADEQGDWDCHVEPFLRNLHKARGPTGYHGVIARATAELAAQAANAGLPMVNVWTGSPAGSLPCVLPNYEACGRLAAQHLLQRGFRQFAFQGYLKHQGTSHALAGFRAVLRASKCRCATDRVSTRRDDGPQGWERYMLRMERWIGGWKLPLGIFLMHDILARNMAMACRHAALRIPDDVALVGLNNETLICTQPEPSLTSIDAGYDRVGYEAAALLDRLMKGEPAPKAPIWIEPTELVVRRSTDVYVVDNPLVAAALRFIAEHSHEGIGVDDVAQHVHVTPRSLRRYFHAALGRTMADEIARLRLERAKRLLVESDEPINRLARDCGFEEAKHFHRVFRAAEGTTPREYRRQRSGKQH